MSKCLAVMNTSDQNSEEEQDEISNNRVKPFQRLKSEEESESEDQIDPFLYPEEKIKEI